MASVTALHPWAHLARTRKFRSQTPPGPETTSGRCTACLQSTQLATDTLCPDCAGSLRPKTAQVLAQARRDPRFAHRCIERLAPRQRAEFLQLMAYTPGLVTTQATTALPGPGLKKCGPARRADATVSNGGHDPAETPTLSSWERASLG